MYDNDKTLDISLTISSACDNRIIISRDIKISTLTTNSKCKEMLLQYRVNW